jgi:hypothetical protein
VPLAEAVMLRTFRLSIQTPAEAPGNIAGRAVQEFAADARLNSTASALLI